MSEGVSVRVLFLSATPRDQGPTWQGAQSRQIAEEINRSSFKNSIRLEEHHAVRAMDLADFLLDRQDPGQKTRYHNGSRKLSLEYLETLHAIVDHYADQFGWQCPTWTRQVLVLTLAAQQFPLVAPATMGRALRSLGSRRGSPKPSVKCPWPAKLRDKVLRSLRVLRKMPRMPSRSSLPTRSICI